MRTHSRRDFLKLSGFLSAGFAGLLHHTSNAGILSRPAGKLPGYGALNPDPQRILDLPAGFSYKVISRAGSKMADGLVVPGRPDGMAAFEGPGGRVILVRNHELHPDDLKDSPFGSENALLAKVAREKMYDYGYGNAPALGGTTTVVYNPRTQQVEKEFLSLAGTTRNCAGGPTPWNSWISCEETVDRQGSTREKDHGFAFEVPVSSKGGLANPLPIRDMGRFNHEAVAVDPRSGIVYQTEDSEDGLIYRYLPHEPGKLQRGGTLQVLAVRERKSADTRNWPNQAAETLFPVGQPLAVEWLDMDHVLAPDNDLRHRGAARGAAVFARGEGMWYGHGEVYFACTAGGTKLWGQVFRYIPSPYEGTPRERESPGTLELYLEPNDYSLLRNCDNLTVAPWGDVVMCEDNESPALVGITPRGEIYRLAKNVANDSEFAGGVFSPDGHTYFVNIQDAGVTLAVTGPWRA